MNTFLIVLASFGPFIILVLAAVLIDEAKRSGDWKTWAGSLVVICAMITLYYQMLSTCRLPSQEESDRFWRDFLDQPQPKEPTPAPKAMRDKTTGEGLSLR